MSKYTTELRYILESESGLSGGYSSIKDVIAKGIPKVFNFNFPIFDDEYRNVLLTKICGHFYTREIGCETYGLWKLRMETKLNEIMPYYNQLYKSELLEFNPLYDIDITKTHSGSDSGTKTENTTTNSNNESTKNYSENGKRNETDERSISSNNDVNSSVTYTSKQDVTGSGTSENTESKRYSDTPQGTLSNIDDNTYLTNATITTNNGKNTTNGTTENSGTDITSGKSTLTEINNNVLSSSNEKKIEETSSGKNNGSQNISGSSSNMTEYIEKVNGKQGGESFAKMLVEFRNTFLNIDMMIIEELECLFFGLW